MNILPWNELLAFKSIAGRSTHKADKYLPVLNVAGASKHEQKE